MSADPRLRPASDDPAEHGRDFIAKSGLGDDLNYVPVDQHAAQQGVRQHLRPRRRQRHTGVEGGIGRPPRSTCSRRTASHIQGLPMTESVRRAANCFIESGQRQGLLIDFNYDTEPLPGKYPLPRGGAVLPAQRDRDQPSVDVRWMYWNILPPGRRTAAAGPDVDGGQKRRKTSDAPSP